MKRIALLLLLVFSFTGMFAQPVSNSGIEVTTGFKVSAPSPIDTRTRANSVDSLAGILNQYWGLITGVKYSDRPYYKGQTGWNPIALLSDLQQPPTQASTVTGLISVQSINKNEPENALDITNAVYKINSVQYSPLTGQAILQEAPEDYYRIDAVVATTSNTFEVIQGQASLANATPPVVPSNKALITYVNIFGGTYYSDGGTSDILYKSQQGELLFNDTGNDVTLEWGNRNTRRWIAASGNLVISSFDNNPQVNSNWVAYSQRPYTIIHDGAIGSTITLKHNAGIGNLKVNLPNAADLVLTKGDRVTLAYSAYTNRVEFVSKNILSGGGGGASTGLEKIAGTGGVFGWRLVGRNPAYYSPIGDNGVDFSNSSAASTIMGASGSNSFATGRSTTASGIYSFSSGLRSIASGISSAAFGYDSFARSWGEFSIGIYGTDYTPTGTGLNWSANDRVFNVGAGTNDENRRDVFTVFKSGLAVLPYADTNIIDNNYAAVATSQYVKTKLAAAGITGNQPEYIGTVYNKGEWFDLSDFDTPTATVEVLDGKLSFTGGTNDYTKTLLLPTYSSRDKFVLSAEFVVKEKSATSYGFGLTAGSGSVNGIHVWFDTTDGANSGKVSMTSDLYPGIVLASPAVLAFSVNDVISLTMERKGSTFECRAVNNTTLAYSLVRYLEYNSYAGAPISIGKYGIDSKGGAFQVQKLTLQTNEVKNAAVCFFGDSKMQGPQSSVSTYAFTRRLIDYYGNGNLHSSPGAKTADLLLATPEVVADAPKTIYLQVGCNDIRAGIPYATYTANYEGIVTQFQTAGIRVIHILPFNESVIDQTPLRNYILDTYDPDDIIDVYKYISVVATEGDGIHPNRYGHDWIYFAVISENKVKPDKFINYYNAPVVQDNLTNGEPWAAPSKRIVIAALANKANLAGPNAFTGVNSFLTAALGNNTTQAATTAFVKNAIDATQLSGNATLNFPSTAPDTSSALTITVTGAAVGDIVAIGIPETSVTTNHNYSARVTATNTVTVRFSNNDPATTVDPASGVFKVKILK